MSLESAKEATEELALRRQLLRLWEKMTDQITPLFLRHHVLLPELEQILRWRATHAALNNPEFAAHPNAQDNQQTFSNAAVVTGLSRQEMARASEAHPDHSPVPLDGGSLHRVIRILTAWRTDPGYQDENGNPIELPLQGATPAFHRLCRKYGRDTPTKPIAEALVRNGNAEWVGNSEEKRMGKRLRYLHPVVVGEAWSQRETHILMQVTSDFLHSLQRMFDPTQSSRPRFREGYYNDVSLRKADDAIEELHAEIQKFSVKCTEILDKYRATSNEPCVRIGVGAYSFKKAPVIIDTASPDTTTTAVGDEE